MVQVSWVFFIVGPCLHKNVPFMQFHILEILEMNVNHPLSGT